VVDSEGALIDAPLRPFPPTIRPAAPRAPLRGPGATVELRARLDGAKAKRRLRGWNPPLENINALVASGGPRLLARSRELVVTNGYAANACEAFAANLVGDGIKPSSLIGDADLARPGAAALARLDRRGGCGRADRLLRPAGHGRAGDVRGGGMLRAAPTASCGGRTARPAAVAASPVRDAALREDGDRGKWQPHPLRDRVRWRSGGVWPITSAAGIPGDSTDQGGGHPGDRARAGGGCAAHLPSHRRGPDPGAAAYRASHGAAFLARPVRRRRTRPEEDRGDVRGVHHQDRAGRADDGRGGGGSRRSRHREPGAGHDAGSAARRGREVLVAGGCRQQLRGVPVSHAAGGLGLAGAALPSRDRRCPAGELLEPAAPSLSSSAAASASCSMA
jgi:hypothetical protein